MLGAFAVSFFSNKLIAILVSEKGRFSDLCDSGLPQMVEYIRTQKYSPRGLYMINFAQS